MSDKIGNYLIKGVVIIFSSVILYEVVNEGTKMIRAIFEIWAGKMVFYCYPKEIMRFLQTLCVVLSPQISGSYVSFESEIT